MKRLLIALGLLAISSANTARAAYVFDFQVENLSGLPSFSARLVMTNEAYAKGGIKYTQGAFDYSVVGPNGLISLAVTLDDPVNGPITYTYINGVTFHFSTYLDLEFLLAPIATGSWHVGGSETRQSDAVGDSTGLWTIGYGTDSPDSPCYGPSGIDQNPFCVATGRWAVTHVDEPAPLGLLLLSGVGVILLRRRAPA